MNATPTTSSRCSLGDNRLAAPRTRFGLLVDFVSRALTDFCGVLLVLVVVLINVEIVLRYFFGSSTLIADEYSGYMFTWMSLLGFGYALQSGQFLRVEAFVDRLHGMPREWVELIGSIAGFAVAVISTYACFKTFGASWRFDTRSIQPSATPLWIPQIGLPFAMGWLSLLYLRLIARHVGAISTGQIPPRDPPRSPDTLSSDVHPQLPASQAE
jgi:TRAP-type C4-dicarboxylate transport system permease small subunit